MDFFVNCLNEWGFRDVIIRSDQEPALRAVLAGVKDKRAGQTILEHSPKFSHQSVGHAEQANAALESQTRTILDRIHHMCGVEVDTKSAVMAWAIRHSGSLITRYRILSNGKTSYEMVKLKRYNGAICEFGEVVRWNFPGMAKNKAKGKWENV